jgi:two-component system KDP operon response regulator KdpE
VGTDGPLPSHHPRRRFQRRLAYKVLVVDDEPQIRLLSRKTLEPADYDVILAADAGEAMRMLGICKPDAVLLDLGLPDRDGLDLVPLIKARTDVALIIVSAREATAEKVAAPDLGADAQLADNRS